MAISFKKQGAEASVATPFKRKQQKQLLLLFGVLLAIAIVIFWGFFGGSQEPEFSLDPENPTARQDSFEAEFSFNPQDYEIDNSFLSRELFDNYKIYGQHLVVVGELGVKDPFVNMK